ncbi:MAG: hypothetical protein AAF587_16810 [Bacteroidota bacterium]
MFLLVQPYPPPKANVRRNRPLAEYEAENQKKTRKVRPISFGKVRLKGIILYPLIGSVILGLVAMANNYQENMQVKDIHISFMDGQDNAFLLPTDIEEIVGSTEECRLLGENMNSLDLHGLETLLKDSPYIEDAEVFSSMMGALYMEVDLREPVARIINNSGNHLYVDAAGKKFPTTRKYTANVPFIRGDFEEGLVDTFACSTVESAVPVMDFIANDPFWNAQIAEVVIHQSGELSLHTQVGDLKVEFGYPVRIEEKFMNLMDFYRQVIPEVGWKYYRSIILKYKGLVYGRKR